MRIAIDARELSGHLTGVGRYLLQVLMTWTRMPEAQAHEFVLFTTAPVGIDPGPLKISTVIGSGGGARWTQLTLPSLVRRAKADVLFAPAYESPLLVRTPTVLSVYDVSFAAHPEWFGPRERLRRQLLTRVSAHRASTILTCSEFSKQEIVRYLHVDPARVEVAYPGVTHVGRNENVPNPPSPGGFPPSLADRDPGKLRRGRAEVRTVSPRTEADGAASDPNDQLVLYVGSLFNRRHLPELIEGFCRLTARRRGPRLEIVGANRTRPHQDLEAVAARWPAGGVHLRDYLPDDELGALYRRARAFAFLSDYEGFGMTPLEALAARIPILVLDTPVSREIYGAAALYIPRPDPAPIEAAIERLLWDEQERSRMLAAAAGVLQRYSWETCAQQTLRALLRAGA